jgi:hypothetical protein
MKSYESGQSQNENASIGDGANRRREAILSALAGKGKETAVLSRQVQEVMNELYDTYKKLVLWLRDGNGGSARRGEVLPPSYYETLERKEALKRRYEELLTKLQEAGQFTIVRELREQLSQTEQRFRRIAAKDA